MLIYPGSDGVPVGTSTVYWHQNGKPRENYCWRNNVYLYLGLSFLWTTMQFHRVLSLHGFELNNLTNIYMCGLIHDDVIKWKHFPRYWPLVRGIHRSPVNSPHKGQCRGALMFSLICVWTNDWINNREAGDLRRYRTHYDVTIIVTDRSYVWIHMGIVHIHSWVVNFLYQ